MEEVYTGRGTGGTDQNHPQEKEMEEGKVVVWESLTKPQQMRLVQETNNVYPENDWPPFTGKRTVLFSYLNVYYRKGFTLYLYVTQAFMAQ